MSSAFDILIRSVSIMVWYGMVWYGMVKRFVYNYNAQRKVQKNDIL